MGQFIRNNLVDDQIMYHIFHEFINMEFESCNNLSQIQKKQQEIYEMGFKIGNIITEKISEDKFETFKSISNSGDDKYPAESKKKLNTIKFLCNSFWPTFFNKNLTSIVTNSQFNIYTAKEKDFPLLNRIQSDDQEEQQKYNQLAYEYLRGLISGFFYSHGTNADVKIKKTQENEIQFQINLQS